jgi:hypothetical protein
VFSAIINGAFLESNCQSLIWYFAANTEEAGKQRRIRKTEESRGMEDCMTLQGLVVFQKDSKLVTPPQIFLIFLIRQYLHAP